MSVHLNKEKLELKQQISPGELAQLMHQFIDACETQADFPIDLQGQRYVVPGTAFKDSKIELEYEEKQDECEFEVKMKWRKQV